VKDAVTYELPRLVGQAVRKQFSWYHSTLMDFEDTISERVNWKLTKLNTSLFNFSYEIMELKSELSEKQRKFEDDLFDRVDKARFKNNMFSEIKWNFMEAPGPMKSGSLSSKIKTRRESLTKRM